MIIGGHAVLLYGEPRLTRDIDITLGIGLERIDEILSIIKKINLNPIPRDVKNFIKKTMVLPTIDKKQIFVLILYFRSLYTKCRL